MFYHERWPLFYEDNHLLVVYKPAGLIMQQDYKNKANLLDLAKLWIKSRYAKPGNVFIGMVHRLDGPVAGVVVLARTSKAAARLSEQFRQGMVQKNYLAVVQGRPCKPEGRLVQFLVRNGRYSHIAADDTNGAQQAALSYHLLESGQKQSLLQITLETGRRHQIRAQLAHLGCPILGDAAYGAAQSMAHGCIALLAHELTFIHPVRKTRLQFESPIPQGWPWPGHLKQGTGIPLWSKEDFEKSGVVLPVIR